MSAQMSSSANIFNQFIARKIRDIHVRGKFSPHIPKAHGFHEKARGRKLARKPWKKGVFMLLFRQAAAIACFWSKIHPIAPTPLRKKRQNKILEGGLTFLPFLYVHVNCV
jgi:hypothetical protein